MSLLVNVQKVSAGEVALSGALPPEALEVEFDETVSGLSAVRYALRVVKHDRGLSISGALDTEATFECVRCLRPFTRSIALPEWRAFGPLEGEEKLSVFNDCVDLTPLVRDDILLNFPRHPTCGRPDCELPQGRKRPSDADASGETAGDPSVWSDLDNLNL